MFKFFRRIRYDLMGQNKASKYFLYAIGEIVLVVIGILIALQLNQFKNDQSNFKQKQNVLKALQLEFKANLSQLDTVLSYNNKVITAYPMAMDLINSEHDIVDEEAFYEPTKNLGFTWSFNPINGALRSGISSGEIHLISNDRLMELLFSWEDIVKDSEEEAHKQRNHQLNSITPISKYIRLGDVWLSSFPGTKLSRRPSDFSGLYHDVLFEDYVTFSFFNASEYATELNIIKTINLEILELIDKELKE